MTVVVELDSEQVGALSAITGMLVDVDRTISQMLAVKEGLLALGSRLAGEIGESAARESAEPVTASQAADLLDLAGRTVATEFAAALRMSDRSVERQMGDADDKVTAFPRVWRAQGAGLISAGHARVIIEAGAHIDDGESRDAYSAQMIEFARSTSSNRVARMARRVAERFQPRSVDERHRQARRGRRVWVRERADGMAELGLLGPATLVRGAYERLTALGIACVDDRATRAETGDQRTLDEARCDIALDLLLTGAAAGHDPEGSSADVRGAVSITVPLTTLMGLGGAPAELDGRMPIDGATARRIAAAAPVWERVFTHPSTGAILAVDRYRPSAELRRWLIARDQRCRFPGCGYLARECDIDHTEDAARGGPTDAANLGALCRRHHVMKHQTPWVVEQIGGGLFAWTSPTGRTYVDEVPVVNVGGVGGVPARADEELPPF